VPLPRARCRDFRLPKPVRSHHLAPASAKPWLFPDAAADAGDDRHPAVKIEESAHCPLPVMVSTLWARLTHIKVRRLPLAMFAHA
jgi:hypothetical protein